MVYEAGISLKLSENAVERLTLMEAAVSKLIPQMEKLEASIGSVGNMKGINKSLNQMSKNLQNIQTHSGGLAQVQQRITNVGNSAARSSGQMSGFGHSIKGFVGGAVAQLGLLAATYMGVTSAADGFKKAMDFQQQMGALSFVGFNTKQKTEISNLATTLPGKYAVSPGDIAHYAKFALGAGLSTDEAISSIKDAARFEHAMKKILDPKVRTDNIADFGLKISELAGKRNPKGIKEIQDILLQTEGVYGGILPLDQLLRQYSMMRLGRIGADPKQSMLIAGHFLAEQMGGSGGSASSGGVGVMIQAFQRGFVQGAMPLSAIGNLQKAGLLTGVEGAEAKMRAQKIAEHHSKGSSSKIIHISKHGVTTDASGMHVIDDEHSVVTKTKGGKAWEPKIHMTATAMREFGVTIKDRELAQKRPLEYMFTKFIPGLERFAGWKPGDFFNNKKIDDTQRVTALSQMLPGTRATLMNLIGDLTIYHKRIEAQQARMGKMPGVDKLISDQDQTKVRLEKLGEAWEAFNVKLWNNQHVLDALNSTIDRLTNVVMTLTKSIDPIMNAFARIGFWADKMNGPVGANQSPLDVINNPNISVPGALQKHNGHVVSGIERGLRDFGHGIKNLVGAGHTSPSGGFVPPPPAGVPNVWVDPITGKATMTNMVAPPAPVSPAMLHPTHQHAPVNKMPQQEAHIHIHTQAIIGTDPSKIGRELWKHIKGEAERDARKVAHTFGYTGSGGQGNLTSPYTTSGGHK